MRLPPDRNLVEVSPPPRKMVKCSKNSDDMEKQPQQVGSVIERAIPKTEENQLILRTVNRVTPSSAAPELSTQQLKNELLGKLKTHRIDNAYHRLLREGKSNHSVSSHGRLSSKTDATMRGQNTANREASIEVKREDGDRERNRERVAPRAVLPPMPIGPPKAKPQLVKIDIAHEIKELLKLREPLYPPKFRFDITPEAAYYNLNLLKTENFNLEKLLNDHEKPSITTYGSEFKQVQALENLLKHHPRWAELKQLLQHGSKWDLIDLNKESLMADSVEAAKRGNHKSAQKNQVFLVKALSKEIEKGWELLLPASALEDIPNLGLSPMGVAEHLGVQEDGTFAPKMRVTHDLSFPGAASDQSINSRVVEDTLEPCMFGHALLRVIHRIVHLRKMHPHMKIYIRKDDAKSAYRRVHLNAHTSFQSAVQIEIDGNAYILLALRLPFGGSPCPSEFCLVSDIIADIINDLLAHDSWDPYWVHSSFVKHIPGPKALPEDVPYAPALDTSVPNMEGDRCSADVFIDDVITIGVDIGNNIEKLMAAPCTVMHALAHASEGETHLPRQNFIASDKNEAEGAPEEVKIVLGWELNTREMLIKLPKHKFKAWSTQLASFMTRKRANGKDLQSLLGRLEQVATIIPMFGHFLNNIRNTEIQATATGKSQMLNKRTREDLKLAEEFLQRADRGINLNLISFRVPTHIYINDASEHGIGGFATHGRAWVWVIPPKLRGRAHINLLEFIAQVVSIWIDVLEEKVKPLDCLLGMGDNTASMGWMRRANFREKNENDHDWYAKQVVARKLARLVLESNAVLYRQWFKGAENTVADSLSRDAYFLPCHTHQQFLSQTTPHQVPPNFKVSQVPSKISSFISSTLLLLPVQQQRLVRPKPSELALGHPGILSSYKLESLPHSLRGSPDSNKISSCQRLHKQPAKPPSLKEIEQSWWREQSTPPSHMWRRPSGQTTGLTPDWTSTVKRVSSSRSNSGGIRTKMGQGKNRRRYQ